MTQSETILKTLKDHLSELKAMGVKDLYVFGSVARGEPHPHDVDILVEFDKVPGLVGFIGLKQHIEAFLNFPVDLVTRRGCSPRLYSNIEPELRHVA